MKDDALWKVYLPTLGNMQDTPFRRVGFRQLAAQLQAFLREELDPAVPGGDE